MVAHGTIASMADLTRGASKPVKDKTHIPCPCGKSSDAYTVYTDGHGYCHGQCGGRYFKENELELNDPVPEFTGDYHYEYITRRGISAATHEFAKVKAKVNSETGEPISVSYPYRQGAKVRNLREKGFHTVGSMSQPGGFGPDLFPAGSAKTITIVEGEDDFLSMIEMFGKYPVWSPRSSVFARADATHDYEYLSSFEKVVLCLDDDEPGRKARDAIAAILDPKRLYHVRCAPLKDPTDYLENGKTSEFKKIWFNATRFLPEGIISTFGQVQNVLDNARKHTRWATPFTKLNFLLGGGLELHRAYLVSGLTGIGKTEFFRAIQHKLYHDSPDANLGILHFEEPVDETVKRAVGYEKKTPVHLDESHVTDPEIMETWKALAGREDRVHFVQHFGSEEPDVILSKIRFLVAGCGCSYIFLDNITILGTGRVQEDERKELDYLSTQLEMLVKELPFCLIFISHENESEGTRGSMNINKVCDVWINLKRDVENENEFARSILYFLVKKNRQASRTGPAGRAVYDLSTATLSELTEELPT